MALAVTAALLGGAAAWLVATFDADRAKSLAIAWMQTHRNRSLAIDGPLELALFPRLQVRLSKARLSEPGSADTFASLDEAALSVALWPLLSKSVVIDGVSARGLHLALRRDAQGLSNIDDLLGGGAAAAADGSKTAPSAATALRFDVSRIEIDDLKARIDDALLGLKGEVGIESLVSGRLADKTESPLKLKLQFALEAPALRGSLSGETKIALDLAGHDIALREMALVFKGDAPGASGVDATLKGALGWNSAQGTLRAEALALDGAATLGTLKLAGSSLKLQRFGFDPTQQNLALAGLALRLQGAALAGPIKLALDWPQLDVKGRALQGSALSGSFALEGTTRLSGSFKSAPPSGDFEQVKVPGFEATWAGSSGPRKLSGTLASELTLRPAERSLALARIDLAVQAQDAAAKVLALALRGDAAVSPGHARWTADGQIAGSPFSTHGDAVLSGPVPRLKVQARFEALDLNALLRPATAGPAASGANGGTGADTPIDLSPLRSVDGQFELRAGSIAFDTLRGRDAVLEAVLDGGKLRLDTLRGQAWGGSVDASGSAADATTGRVTIKALASGVNVNQLQREATGRDLLEGTGRVALDLQASGRSINELKSQLQGTAALQLRDGAVKGIDLSSVLRQARSALASKKDASVSSVQTEKTIFSALSVSFQVADGVARSTDLDLKSPLLRIGGAGVIDLGRGSIDYTVRVTPLVTPGVGGLLALQGLTLPVHLNGPLAAIEWRVEWSSVALATAQSQIKGLLGGLKPPGPAASGAAGPAGADPRKELTQQLFKGLFK